MASLAALLALPSDVRTRHGLPRYGSLMSPCYAFPRHNRQGFHAPYHVALTGLSLHVSHGTVSVSFFMEFPSRSCGTRLG